MRINHLGAGFRSRYLISKIAFQVSYHSIGSFRNAFFEFTNSRPSDFRKD